jgi:hypothetical protein
LTPSETYRRTGTALLPDGRRFYPRSDWSRPCDCAGTTVGIATDDRQPHRTPVLVAGFALPADSLDVPPALTLYPFGHEAGAGRTFANPRCSCGAMVDLRTTPDEREAYAASLGAETAA